MDNDWIVFDARFGGRAFNVSVPTAAVLAIFARENGAGMQFGEEEPPDDPPPEPEDDGGKGGKARGQPALRIVK